MFGKYGKFWLVVCCTCFALQVTYAFLKLPKLEEWLEKKEALDAKKEAEWAKFVDFFEEKKKAELDKMHDFLNLFAEKKDKEDDYKDKSYKKTKPKKQPCDKYVEKVVKTVYESAEESYGSKPKYEHVKKPKVVIKEKPKYHKSGYENDSPEESVEAQVIIKKKPKYHKRIYDNDSEEEDDDDDDISAVEAYGKKRAKYSDDDKELVYKAADKPLYKSPVIEPLPCHLADDNDGCGKFLT